MQELGAGGRARRARRPSSGAESRGWAGCRTAAGTRRRVVRGLEVVEPDDALQPLRAVEDAELALHAVERGNVGIGELRPQRRHDVGEPGIRHHVHLGQAVHPLRAQVDEEMVVGVERVRVGVARRGAPLVEFAAGQAGVDVVLLQRHRAHMLEVKVERAAVDRVHVGALGAMLHIRIRCSRCTGTWGGRRSGWGGIGPRSLSGTNLFCVGHLVL